MAANSISLGGLARRLVVDELLDGDAVKEASEQAQKDRTPFVKHLVDRELVSAIDIANALAEMHWSLSQERQEMLYNKKPFLRLRKISKAVAN